MLTLLLAAAGTLFHSSAGTVVTAAKLRCSKLCRWKAAACAPVSVEQLLLQLIQSLQEFTACILRQQLR
jgi:hypothetical protein